MKLRFPSFLMAAMLLLGFSAFAQPVITITAAPGDTICARTSVTFTATVTGGTATYAYVWKVNGTTRGTTAATFTTAMLRNGDTVNCLLTNVAGDTTWAYSDTIHMVVNNLPMIPMITGTGNVCVGDTMMLADSLGGGVWSSSNPMVATVTATGIVTAISAPAGFGGGGLRIYYALTNGCGTDSARFRVRVGVPAGPVTAPPTICIDSIAFVTDTAMGGMWTSSDTTIANFLVPIGILQGVMPGTVTITDNITNACGTYTETATITVVNCDSASGVAPVVAAVNGCSIYPNPAAGAFTVKVNSGKYSQASCTIYSMVGQKVKDFTMATNKETSVDLNVPAGVYFITVTAGAEKYTSKIVITQ